MTNTMLLAVDDSAHSQHAAEVCERLASLTKSTVVVMHVHELATGRWGSMRVDDNTGDAFAETTVKSLQGAGIEAKIDIREARYGQVAQALSTAAEDLDAEVIVLGSRGRSNVAAFALGGVAHKLLHIARRPVMVVPSV